MNRLRKLGIAMILCAAFGWVAATAVAATVPVTVDITGPSSVEAGNNTVTVSVNAKQVSNLAGIQFTLDYDHQKFALQGKQSTDFTEIDVRGDDVYAFTKKQDQEPGKVEDLVVSTFVFQVKAAAGEKPTIRLKDVKAVDVNYKEIPTTADMAFTVTVTAPPNRDNSDNGQNTPDPKKPEPDKPQETTADGKPKQNVPAETKVERGANGKNVASVVADEAKLKEAAANANEATVFVIEAASAAAGADEIKTTLGTALLDGLRQGNAGNVVQLKTPLGTIDLPVKLFNPAEIAAVTGRTNVSGATVTVSVAKVDAGTRQNMTEALSGTEASMLSEPIDFMVVITVDGEDFVVSSTNGYLSRSVSLNKESKSEKEYATGVMYDEASGTYLHVPTLLYSEDGKDMALLKRRGLSIYTVVSRFKTFDDIRLSWAKTDIEALASRFIINGTSEKTFSPDTNITRAEYTAILMRALGMPENEDAAKKAFSDVGADAWYAGVVGAAFESGLITGYPDGTFRPERSITRQEVAVLLSRAMAFAEKPMAVNSAQSKLATAFKDGTKDVWNAEALVSMVEANIMRGTPEGEIRAASPATRAEVTAMIKRFLVYVEFMSA